MHNNVPVVGQVETSWISGRKKIWRQWISTAGNDVTRYGWDFIRAQQPDLNSDDLPVYYKYRCHWCHKEYTPKPFPVDNLDNACRKTEYCQIMNELMFGGGEA